MRDFGPFGRQDPQWASMRASDAEREQVVEQLQNHYVDGRLDSDELVARMDQVWASQTRGELQHVLQDLPKPPGSHEPTPVPKSAGSFKERTGLSTVQLVLLCVAAVVLLPIVFRILRMFLPILVIGVIVWLLMRNRSTRA